MKAGAVEVDADGEANISLCTAATKFLAAQANVGCSSITLKDDKASKINVNTHKN